MPRLSESQRARCLQVAAQTVDLLLERALCHRDELYWDLGGPARETSDRKILELSLGFGTPGILLFLALYYRQTRDERIPEYLESARKWVLRRLKASEKKVPGFYVGTLGTHYALIVVEELLGKDAELCANREAVLDDARHFIARSGVGCGLSNGWAGTLLALDLLNPPGAPAAAEFDAIKEAVIQQLLHQLIPASPGLASGRQFDAIQTSVGFFSGCAGVRYTLGRYREVNAGARWIVAGLDRYQEAAFEQAIGNWKDYINEGLYNSPEHSAELNRSLMQRDRRPFAQYGDNIGWGAGTAGILVAHLPHGSSQTMAGVNEAVTDRGYKKLIASAEQLDAEKSRFSLYDGWGGIAISVVHCLRDRPNSAMDDVVERIAESALTQHERQGRFALGPRHQASALGLLTGESGVGYCLLQLATDCVDERVIRPLRPTGASSSAALRDVKQVRATVILNSLPLTCALLPEITKTQPEGLSLEALVASAEEHVSQGGSELARQVLDYERLRLELEQSAGSNLYLAGREANAEQLYKTIYRDGDPRQLMHRRFRLAAETRLGLLSFGLTPGEDPPVRGNGQTLILLHAKSDGLHDWILDPVSYAVLKRLDAKKPVAKALANAWHIWPLSDLQRPDAEQRVGDILKRGLAAGYIEPAD